MNQIAEVNPKYLAETAGNTVPAGYKQTEVGVIPVDWRATCLGGIAEVRMCKRILAGQTKKTGAIPFFKIGTFGSEPDAYIPFSLYEEFKTRYSFPNEGDVLISAAGTLGKSVVYDGAPAYFQDSNIVWLEINKREVLNEYLYYYYKVIKWASSEGSTIARLYNGIIRASIIALPSIEEQTAIVNALSNVDALISELEKLIAKKQAIKTVAMQQLLTGKTRLPEFEGEWEVRRLGDITDIVMGQSPSSSNYNSRSDGLPLIQGNADIVDRRTIERIFTTQITKRGKEGDVLMSVRAPVGEISRALFDVCLGRGVCAIRFPNDFLYHYLIFLEPAWAKHSKGSTFDSVNSADVKAVEVKLPSDPKEQTGIAQVLSDIDAEIAAFEQRRNKTKAIKQAMMQELLTGKTRLIQGSEAV